MGATLRTDKILSSNVQITSKGVWEHLHELAHYQLPAAGSYRVEANLRGQIRQSLTTGSVSDYVALVAGLFVDGALVGNSEVLVCNSRTDGVNVQVSSASPTWEVHWDGQGPGVLEVRFVAVYVPATRNNANDVVLVAQDGNGRCLYNVTAL